MSVFKFKQFDVRQEGCAQKVGTDAMVLGALVESKDAKRILDVGTGNGVIALMLAQKLPKSTITGIEFNNDCAKTAEFNFHNSPFSDRLNLWREDFNNFEAEDSFDLIVSNPPFFKNSTLSPLSERTAARHETTLLLPDLLRGSSKLMSENAELWIIVPDDRCSELVINGKEVGLHLIKRIDVFGKPEKLVRSVLAFKKCTFQSKVIKSALTIRNSEGSYTPEYKNLTIDFHFNDL